MVKYCPECGEKLKDNVKFCQECGHSFYKPNNKPQIKKDKEQTKPPKPQIKKDIENEQTNPQLDLKKVGILAAIVVIIIIIAATVISIQPAETEDENVTITITSTDSYSSESDSGISYSYSIDGIVYSTNQYADLESYYAKITYYSGDTAVKTDEGFILSTFDGANEISNYISLETPVNITDVQIEIINNEGKIVGSQKAPFIMGDMTPS